MNISQEEQQWKHLVEIIRSSLLFDEEWCKTTYGLGEYANAAEHYLMQRDETINPSILFSSKKYLDANIDVKNANVNPLLHFELFGKKEGRKEGVSWENIKKNNPLCLHEIEDGILRLRITNACNAKCRFCGVRLGFGKEATHAMDPKWYYEYCKPLYKHLKMVLITGGDAYIAKESHAYMKFLSENYPKITIFTESNGIAFDEKFQKLAADNLFKTHFSINASNRDIFQRGCWEGAGGESAYDKLINNVKNYVDLLKTMHKECFSPSVSLVINKDTYMDVVEFVKLGLELHASAISFYFDYTESNMANDSFGNPETSRYALQILMEIERVLAGKVMIYFRLWIPAKEVELMQNKIEIIPIEKLQKKYEKLLFLATGRSMRSEFENRNKHRRDYGKKELVFDEDFSPTIRMVKKGGIDVCFAPWKELDLYPDGRLDFCGWFAPTCNLKDYIKNETVQWEDILNSYEFMSARKRMLNHIFEGCQTCCPMNDVATPITPVYKYGYQRLALNTNVR